MRNWKIRISALMVLLTAFYSAAFGDRARVVYIDGRKEGGIEVMKVEGIFYTSLVSLAQEFGGSLYWAPLTKKMVLSLNDGRITTSAFNSTIVTGDKAVNLPLDPIIEEGAVYVPAGPFIRILDGLVPDQLRWEEERGILVVEPLETNITGLAIEERANGTLMTIRVSEDLEVEDTTSQPSWVHLSFYGGRLDPNQIIETRPKGDVREIRAYQYESSAQISLLLSRKVGRYEILRKENPRSIILSLRRSQDIDADREQLIFHTIVIDPGHGGKDTGSIGPTGLKEKDVALDIAKRLVKLLRDNLKVRVVLTRSTDTFVKLEERSRIANRSKGMMFISIHCNSNRNRGVNGSETYFLSEAKTEEAREVARRENSSLRFEDTLGDVIDDDFTLSDISLFVPDIINGMASSQYLKESQDLAALVQRNIIRATGLEDRGVKQAAFYVMKGTLATMPSILVETGFISNPYEEKLLKRTSFRKKIAEAIFRAVKDFKREHEIGLVIE